MLSQFNQICTAFPETWGTVEPRYLESYFNALYPDFVTSNPIFPKYDGKNGTRLDMLCKPMGALKGKIYGKDTAPEVKEAAQNELTKRECELEAFMVQSLESMTEENAWDYSQDRALSFCPQIIFHLCLMRNAKMEYKVDYSNKEYSVEFLFMFHSETYGVGNYLPCLKKIMNQRPELYRRVKLIEWKMVCRMAQADNALKLCSANHWAEDLLNEEFVNSLVSDARLCQGAVASEFAEYVSQGVVNIVGEDYDEKDLHDFFDMHIAPRIAQLKEAGVIVCIDDLKNSQIFPVDANGAHWNTQIKSTSRAHINTNVFYQSRKQLFDVVKTELSTAIYGTATGEETVGHVACAFGHVYSNKSGFNTSTKIEASTGKRLGLNGQAMPPTLTELRHACGIDISQTWNEAIESKKRFICEGTCPLEAIVSTVGLANAIEYGSEQGGVLFETKVPISLLFTESVHDLAKQMGVKLPAFAASDAEEEWEEMSLEEVKELQFLSQEMYGDIESTCVYSNKLRRNRHKAQELSNETAQLEFALSAAKQRLKRKSF